MRKEENSFCDEKQCCHPRSNFPPQKRPGNSLRLLGFDPGRRPPKERALLRRLLPVRRLRPLNDNTVTQTQWEETAHIAVPLAAYGDLECPVGFRSNRPLSKRFDCDVILQRFVLVPLHFLSFHTYAIDTTNVDESIANCIGYHQAASQLYEPVFQPSPTTLITLLHTK